MTKQIKIPEEWRPIDEWPTYEVSNRGNVRRWYDKSKPYAEIRARITNPFRADVYGYGDVFPIKLKIGRDNKVDLELMAQADRIVPLEGDNAVHGYAKAAESPTDNYSTQSRGVARLALAAFVGPPSSGEVACHRDGNAANNGIENLYWGKRGRMKAAA